jgi:PAS domain S-box-containing protein
MKTMKAKYYTFLTIIISTLLIIMVIVYYDITNGTKDARYINMAGTQCMLSQKILACTYKSYVENKRDPKIDDTWQQWHNAALTLYNTYPTGNTPLNDGDGHIINTWQVLLKKTEQAHHIIIKTPPFTKADIDTLQALQASFLTLAEAGLGQLKQQSATKLASTKAHVSICVAFALLALFIDNLLSYQPLQKRLKENAKKSEQEKQHLRNTTLKLKAALNSANHIWFMVGKDYRIIEFNEAARKGVLNDHRVEITQGQDLRNYVKPEFMEAFLRNSQAAFNGQVVKASRRVTHGNHTAWYEFVYCPVHDDTGAINAFIFNAEDITELKQAEIKLEEQNTMLRQIIWNHSHIIRMPIVNISGIINLIHTDAKEMQEDYLAMIEKEIKRLDQATKDIIHFAVSSLQG